MTDQWDRFDSGAIDTLNNLGFSDNVELFQPTESYDNDGDGYATTYPATPTETVAGESEPISATSDTNRGGTTREADLLVHVTTDISTAVNDAGDNGEALTRIEIAKTDETYEVLTVEPSFDGLQTLVCSEVDT